jgi:hypothetical protein
MSPMPHWPVALANLGKAVFSAAEDHTCPPFTIALCVPRLDFAAAFIGVGIISKYLTVAEFLSEEQRIKDLVGKSVVFDTGTGNRIAGRLEYCEIRGDYKICEYARRKSLKSSYGAHVLERKDWNAVRPVNCEFSLERRVSRTQIARISKRLSSLDSLGPVFGLPLEEAATDSACLFTIFGNKSRLHDELRQNLEEGTPSSLQGILRPQSLQEFESSFRCRLESRDSRLFDGCGIVIAEASRSLSDLLLSSRSKHRVVLLGRNSADYEECSSIVLDAFGRRKDLMPSLTSDLPQAVQSLTFYHS